MALVCIEPITDKMTASGAAASDRGPVKTRGPLKLAGPRCPGGGEGHHSQDDHDKAQQRKEERKKERDRPLSEEHKNKRRKLNQLELGQMIWGAPDKDG